MTHSLFLLHPCWTLSTRPHCVVECLSSAHAGLRHTKIENRRWAIAGNRLERLAALATMYGLQSLACFFFSALFQRRLTRKFYAAFVVDTDAFDPNHVANLDHVLSAFHSKIGEFGNVHQAVFAWENFNKRPELLRRDDASLIGLSDLDFAGHATDNFLRARHALASRCVDVH